uniref:ATP synthase F0 subunit 8 n=1 Tax=Halisarca dujardinii TaxID=2583056 RepID=I6LID6_HALDU|nr:ATP synthase F0 subunit 8 [Halisarca dujardinii]ABW76600.1 ATP synthase F0 subunit 8 [Halisarca dujardinii]
MPQLDLLTFLTQYIWTLIILGSIFILLVTTILPNIQQQFVIRSKVVEGERGAIDAPGVEIFQQLLTLKLGHINK